MMSHCLLTKERFVTQRISSAGKTMLPMVNTHCLCFQKWFISQKLPKEIKATPSAKLSKLCMPPRPAI